MRAHNTLHYISYVIDYTTFVNIKYGDNSRFFGTEFVFRMVGDTAIPRE